MRRRFVLGSISASGTMFLKPAFARLLATAGSSGSVSVPQTPTAVNFSPAGPLTVFNNITTGSTISTVSVSTSDSLTFVGTTSLIADAGGRVILSGNTISPAHNFTSADNGTSLTITVQASENSVSVSGNLTLNVVAPGAVTTIRGGEVPLHGLGETGWNCPVRINGSGAQAPPVTGTITLTTASIWLYGGAPGAGTYTAQWYIDSDPVGPQLTEFTAGLPPVLTLSVNTVALGIADGTHVAWIRFLDHTASAAYYMGCFPANFILHNSGYISGSQVVPIAWTFDGVGRATYPNPPDFVNYSGVPNPTIAAFPFTSTFIAPAGGVGGQATFSEYLNESRVSEYRGNPNWTTLSPLETGAGDGGVYIQTVTPEIDGFSSVEGGYIPGIAYNPSDGQRCDNTGTGLVTLVDAPDGNSVYFVEVQGRLCQLSFTGTITTIAGYRRDKSKLSYSQKITDEATLRTRQELVGNFPADLDLGGSTDLCFDPRDSTKVYVVTRLDHRVFLVDMATTPATVTIYAGTGAAGYHDDPNPLLAVFDMPTSIIMTDGVHGPDPAGVMYVADWNNCVIRKIASPALGVAGAVTTFLGTQATRPTANAVQSSQPQGGGPSIYSPATNVAFGSVVMAYPFTIRFNSVGDIVIFENITLHARRVNLVTSPTSNVVSLGWYGTDNPGTSMTYTASSPDGWGWMDVDSAGTIGEVDAIYMAQVTSGDGLAEQYWRIPPSLVGGSGIGAGIGYPVQKVAASGGLVEQGWGHYPWGIGISRHQGRLWTTGAIYNSIVQTRIIQPNDPNSNAVDANYQSAQFLSGNYVYVTGTVSGRGPNVNYWPSSLNGIGDPNLPAPFAWGLRPTMSMARGNGGGGHLGAWPGASTFDEIKSTYSTESAARAYIASGMGSSFPRPELTGNDARDLAYWMFFNTVDGSTDHSGTTFQPWADDPDTGNYPTILAISAVRNSATSITVSWTTDKPTIGYAAAGSVNQLGLTPPYCVFSPIESGYGTSHSATITTCPSGASMYYTCRAKDMAGNSVYANTQGPI